VPYQVKIIELPITSADDGEYMPSTVKLIELFDMKRHVLSIIW
jgi:hypothetical protein